jgi:hypothetical protein
MVQIAKEGSFGFLTVVRTMLHKEARRRRAMLAATFGERANDPRMMPDFNRARRRDVRPRPFNWADYKVAKSYCAARTADEQCIRCSPWLIKTARFSAPIRPWLMSRQAIEHYPVVQGGRTAPRQRSPGRIVNEPNMCGCAIRKSTGPVSSPFQMKPRPQLFAPMTASG